jgi:hypothetical protein
VTTDGRITGGSSVAVTVAANSIDTTKLQAGAVDTTKIVNGAVTTNQLADLAVTNAKIAANAVDTSKLAVTGVAAGTYGSAGFVPVFTVTTDGRITGGSSVALSVAANSIDTTKLQPGSVDTTKIVNGAITTNQLADLAVTNAKIADGSVDTAKLASDAVTTLKILDANVTGQKIAASAIDTTKLQAASVDTTKIVDGGVTNVKIADGAVDTSKLAVTGVAAGTYGSASMVPVFTVTTDGRITGSSQAPMLSPLLSVVTISSTYTAATADNVILCSGGTFTLTLYTASGNAGRVINLKNYGTGVVTIAAAGAETIDGAATQTLNVQYGSYTLISDGTRWHIL